MRHLEMFTIYDQKAGFFLSPFSSQNEGTAKRDISAMANDMGHQFGMFPHDFHLYSIGQYDHETGVVTPVNPPVHICPLLSLVTVKTPLPLEAESARLAQNEPETL